jgi:hypothetical protein
MSLFFRREKQVREQIQQYFEAADEALSEFEVALRCFLRAGDCDEFQDCTERVHAAESLADDIRHEIEKTLYSRSLLPEARGDLLGLLEHFDKMPNLAETITFMCETRQVTVPERFREQMVELLVINMEAYHLVRETTERLFVDPKSVGEAVDPVDIKESESDRLERSMTREIFSSDMSQAQMILLRELVQRVGDISDSAENVARRLEIIALKKRI